MIKTTFKLLSILCLIILTVSCSIERNKSLVEIEEQLKSASKVEKEQPFIRREFRPYLNDEWIGNAVSYGCYRKGQAPWGPGPTDEEIKEDLDIIVQHWNLIRVYNADDDTERIISIIEEHDYPIKVMLGVWLEKESENELKKAENVKNVLRAIDLARKHEETVLIVNVGNETQVFWSWHKMKEENLRKYIRVVRNNIAQPVTTADDYNFWNKPDSKRIASELDLIVTHAYPLWNSQQLDDSIEWLDNEIILVKEQHNGKTVILGEIGWATNYNPDKKGDGQQGTLIKGDVGLKAQEHFLIMLDKWIEKNQVTTFLFEAFDEPWKGGAEKTGANEVEKNWGVFYENREPKQSFINYQLNKRKTIN